MDDVVVNKSATIERCLARVREEYGDGSGLEADLRRQDALVLNLLRACETAIDLAMHAVRKASLGVPQSSRDAFALLSDGGWIASDLAEELQRMVGFRNIAVHGYQDLDLDIVRAIVRDELEVFEAFVRAMLQRPAPRGSNGAAARAARRERPRGPTRAVRTS